MIWYVICGSQLNPFLEWKRILCCELGLCECTDPTNNWNCNCEGAYVCEGGVNNGFL